MYFFYILRCRDNSLYSGITNNLERRIHEHNFHATKSAKYTRTRRPVTLVYQETYQSLKEAMKRERQVKTWPKAKKEALILRK